VGKPRTASGRRRFDHVSPYSAARSSSARHMPIGASPSRPLRLDSDNWRVRSPGGNPRCQRKRPALAWQRLGREPPGCETRTSAPALGHSSLQVDLSAARSRWPRLPFGRPGNPTKFSDSDRRRPWARDPVPGRIKYFNSSNSVAISPNGKVGQVHKNRTERHDTIDTDADTQT
jgi:hypothetical protein